MLCHDLHQPLLLLLLCILTIRRDVPVASEEPQWRHQIPYKRCYIILLLACRAHRPQSAESVCHTLCEVEDSVVLWVNASVDEKSFQIRREVIKMK